MSFQSASAAIRAFFAADGGREVTLTELKALSNDEREELGSLAAKALGGEIVPPKKK